LRVRRLADGYSPQSSTSSRGLYPHMVRSSRIRAVSSSRFRQR